MTALFQLERRLRGLETSSHDNPAPPTPPLVGSRANSPVGRSHTKSPVVGKESDGGDAVKDTQETPGETVQDEPKKLDREAEIQAAE